MNKEAGSGLAIGLALGVAVGVALDNLAMGIGVGVALGLTVFRQLGSNSNEDGEQGPEDPPSEAEDEE